MTSPLSTRQLDTASAPDPGLRLDGARLRRELRRRGVSASHVAQLASVSPNTLTRALAGERITVGSLREIARALQGLPVLPGADELLVVETRNAAVPTTAAFMENSSGAAELRT